MDVINISSGDDGSDNFIDDGVVMSEYACETVLADYDEGVISEDDNGNSDTSSGDDDSDTSSGDDDSDTNSGGDDNNISTSDNHDYMINGYDEGGDDIVRGDDDSHRSDEEEETKVQLPCPKYTVRCMLFI
jgi:hypothetical protein